MPSDERGELVFRALASPMNAYRSALAATVEQVRGSLARGDRKGKDNGTELGLFGTGHIDSERFSALLSRTLTLDAADVDRMQRAFEILSELASKGDEPFTVQVDPGGCLRGSVARSLDAAGRAFGAARVAELCKTGRYVEAEHGAWLDSFGFRLWNRSERRLTPPQVVFVDGADLRAETLAELLDGRMKIVLVVSGEAAPAPLVRLITPRTFVLQTTDGAGLERLAHYDGPGVAALMPEGAARFVHDPGSGEDPWDRLNIESVPTAAPKKAIGWRSAAVQAEELAQLTALATVPLTPARGPAEEAPAMAPPERVEPADKLAAWLLTQANLKDLP